LRALLLAAGFGTRLRPLTERVPKCLVEIHGRPLLGWWFELLFAAGDVERALVNTHYLPAPVRDFVAASRWRDRIELVHEDVLLGTGGTVLKNRAFFGGEPFLVAHADNLTLFDAAAFLRRHRERPAGAAITMMTFDTDVPGSCGIVEEDAAGRVIAFHEKVEDPPGTRANAAVYLFEPEVISFIAGLGREIVDLSTEVLPHYLGRMCTYHNELYHRDIGTRESLAAAEREFPGLGEIKAEARA
jgi:mannose-1-phosphate guanylyltransferase